MNRPNILYLLSDEHSFRAMGHVPEAEGGEPVHTPTFDALAAHATRFTDAYCQMPLCTPSRICQLTGKEVRKSGAWNNESVLRPELPTLPGTLAAAGYATCLVGKMHLGGSLQFVGFQHRPYGDLTGKTGHQWEPIDREDRHGMRTRTAHTGITQIPESLIQDEVVTQESLAWVREHRHAHPDQPWFLCASFSRPHFPLTAPRRHFERYWPHAVTPPRIPAGGDAYDHPMSVGMRRGFMAEEISHDEVLRARAAYFGNVSYLDEVIGDFLLRLDAAGLLENTVIVYTTDHGEMAGEHGVWWKHGWYEGCTRVPLLISLPEQRAGESDAAGRGSQVSTPVGLYDLFPTLCGLADVAVPNDLDGVDLGETLRGGAAPPERPIVCDVLTPRWGAGTEFRMLRWRNYKYVAFRDAPSLFFDLAEDPGEQHNLMVRGCSGDAAEALAFLEAEARTSMNFDAADRERLERDGGLHAAYPLDLPRATGNVYLFADGRLVNADDAMLYAPTVLTEDSASVFGDWPEESPE
jgi:choline-sulfatase